jgi:hypothetical protein
MKKRIILLICSKSDYLLQIELARKLKEFRFIRPICCFNTITNNLCAELTECAEEGFDTMEIFGVDNFNSHQTNLDDANDSEDGSPFDLFRKTFNNRRMVIKLFRELVRKLEVELVITSNNDLRYLMPYVMKACALEKIKTVFIPSAMQSRKSYINLCGSGYPETRANRTSNMLSFCFGRWTHPSTAGKRTLCLPLAELLTLKLLSAAPEHPTSPYGGNADYFFAPNAYVCKLYRDLMPKKTQAIITGTPVSDLLFEALTNQQHIYSNLCGKYNVDVDRKMILVLLPELPLFTWEKKQEFSSFQEFLQVALRRLSSIGADYNIFVTSETMPSDDQVRREVELFPNMRLVTENVTHLIPLCQFYICCDPSTIGMAIACNKPVIDFDFHSLDFEMYKEDHGIAIARNEKEFVRALTSFCGNDQTFLSYSDRQAKNLKEFEPMDGSALKRIVSNIFHILNIDGYTAPTTDYFQKSYNRELGAGSTLVSKF